MADRHHYPDFPLQQRTALSKSPRAAGPLSVQASPYEHKDLRVRDRLPSPLKGLNQVRFRQFKKQIDSIRKVSYELPRKEAGLKAFPDKLRTNKGEGGFREESAALDAPMSPEGRSDLHKQTLGLLKRLEAAKEPLNALYRWAGSEGGLEAKAAACPLCNCSCKGQKRLSASPPGPDTPQVEVNLSSQVYLQHCSRCQVQVLHSSSSQFFLCEACQCGNSSPAQSPDLISLLLNLNIEEISAPARCRTPTPPPIDRSVRSPARLSSNGSESDRSPRKRATVSPRPSLHLHKQSEGDKMGSKLLASLNGVPVRLYPGKQLLRLVLSREWKEVRREVEAPIVPATPCFSTASTPMLFSRTEWSDRALPTGLSSDLLDVSFSQNLLTEPFQPLSLDLSPRPNDCKSLLTEAEYVLSDHIQIATKHGYVFEVPDMCESYVTQYLNLLKGATGAFATGLPEAFLVLDVCLKGLVLVIETALSISQGHDLPNRPKRLGGNSDLRQVLSELAEERRKTAKLEKSLKNVVRNYEEMIVIRGRSEGEEGLRAETSLLEE